MYAPYESRPGTAPGSPPQSLASLQRRSPREPVCEKTLLGGVLPQTDESPYQSNPHGLAQDPSSPPPPVLAESWLCCLALLRHGSIVERKSMDTRIIYVVQKREA